MMRIAAKIWRRIHFLFNRRRLERELAEEMAIHREMMPSGRRAAFGNSTRLLEESSEVWLWTRLQQLWQDLSYGFRVLAGAPGFTLGAVIVLALGIGVNLAEFQIFDALVFQRLPIRDANSVLEVFHVSKNGERGGFPAGAVEFYRARNQSFAWLVSEDRTIALTVEGDTQVRSNFVSPSYFSDLSVVPSWGRLFTAHDAQPGATPVAVLGYPYWRARWGSDARVVGRVVRINNKPVEIIGVLPYDFDGLTPQTTAVWLPVSSRPYLIQNSTPLLEDFSRPSEALFGKLKIGVPQAAGEAELTSLTRELAHVHPRSFDRQERIQAHLVRGSLARRLAQSPPFAVFVLMILLVLFSACANLGSMLLARGLARQREIDIRLAIGASHARIVRQLMIENLQLAALGSIAGLAFGVTASRLLLYALNTQIDIRLPLSWELIAFGVLLTFVSVLFFGLPAALQIARPAHRVVRFRQTLVGVQVAVSCLLLIASAVLAHNGILIASLDLTFDYQKMITIDPELYTQNLQPAAAQQKLETLSLRLSALPGVTGVAAAVAPPFSGRLIVDALPGLPHIYRNDVSPSYFSLMKLPLLRGRTFLPGEQNTVVVSESAARAVWPNEDPIGKIWTLAGTDRTVTGIVKDSGVNLLADPESVEAYVPIPDAELERSAFIVHASGDPAALLRLILASPAGSGETLSAFLMRSARDRYIEGQEKMVMLIGSIGAVATALAAAGMFALVAFTVARRKRELGIRIAIGARPGHILNVLLKQNVTPLACGVIAGVILAVLLTRLVHSAIALQNYQAFDITGYAAGLVCFGVVAILATLSPAMRALRIDPSQTLRED